MGVVAMILLTILLIHLSLPLEIYTRPVDQPRYVVDPETREALVIQDQKFGVAPAADTATNSPLSDEDLQTVNPSFWDTVWDMFAMYDEHMDDRDVVMINKMEKYHALFHKKYPDFMPRMHYKLKDFHE